MSNAIVRETRDADNQAAGKEFDAIQKFVEENAARLSPAAKRVFEIYQKAVVLARARQQTGIDRRRSAQLVAAMKKAGKPT